MPTPTHCFLDVAARYGDVDPTDQEAVQHWFLETLPTLPAAVINEIFEELLANSGANIDAEIESVYPEDAPMPSLTASPAAPIPILAIHVGAVLTKLIRRKEK